MNLLPWIIIVLVVFTCDIAFSIFYVRTKPKGDYWKIPIWIIVVSIITFFGLKVVSEWYYIFHLLITPGFIYGAAKNAVLGNYWHNDPWYLSENHWPDKLFIKTGGKRLFILNMVAAFVFSGLWYYL